MAGVETWESAYQETGYGDLPVARPIGRRQGPLLEVHRLPTFTRQERLAAMGHLAMGVAHDLDNILSAIGVYAELIGAQEHLDDHGRQHVGTICQQVERAIALVWQVLDFVHGRSIEPVDVDVSEFLVDLLPVLRRTSPERILVTVRQHGHPCLVRGDPAQLQQVFMNLATNARDAISGSGEVAITVSRQRRTMAPRDRSTRPDRRLWVRVDVTDTGCGIAPEVLAHALEPFYTTKPPGKGTGLGLAQVHSLVGQHDGHLEIDSTPGQGTTVTVWLPPAGGATWRAGPKRLHPS
ncbi:MAG TPA: ATP-binding protein [Acidimicrobiales bacterium]|nr:ATP-binding protein [Acidimicrobiales bacterium]